LARFPNLITKNGMQALSDEVTWLRTVERPRVVAEVSYAASLGDRSENAEYIYGKKRLRQIDSRLGFLITCMNRIQVVDPADISGDVIRFGATVTLETEDGEEQVWRLYGVHEVDTANGIISWQSPIGRALMGKTAGDAAIVQTPGGTRELEVLDVSYDPQVPLPIPEWKREQDA